jgi:hypothetical protein
MRQNHFIEFRKAERRSVTKVTGSDNAQTCVPGFPVVISACGALSDIRQRYKIPVLMPVLLYGKRNVRGSARFADSSRRRLNF